MLKMNALNKRGVNCFQTFFKSFEGMNKVKEESQPKESKNTR